MLEPSTHAPLENPQAVAADPVLSARLAGLRYVMDSKPGIRRRRQGKGFRYLDPAAQPLRDPAERRRIEALAVPPAWTDVWICPLANGHLQATGRDARGRKQYRYHPDWRAVRDETKFGRMVAFGEALPRLRARLESDLALPRLPREKVLAAVVKLLETTLIRVGNEEYARENDSFGLTTMRSRHVDIDGATVRFHFRGKSGKEHDVAIADRRLARVVRACRELPGYELFQYLDEAGERQAVSSDDVNEYLRGVTGEDFTAKDFRTWGGTVLALAALRSCGAARPVDEAEATEPPPQARQADREREANRAIVEAVKRVAGQLGNRPAICRKYYVHPAVIAAFLEGRLDPSEPIDPSDPSEASGGGGGSAMPRVVRVPPPGPGGLHELEELTLELLRALPPGAPATTGTTAGRTKRAPRSRSERRRRPRGGSGPRARGTHRQAARPARAARSISAASPPRLRR